MASEAHSERPAEFAVELDLTKVTSGLGLEVDWADGKTLFIKSVKAEGAVPHWNKKRLGHAVAAGDRIISINGKGGDPKAMLAVCKKDKQLSLLVRTGSSNASTVAVKKVASGIASAVQHSLAALPSTEDGGRPKQSPKFFDFNVTVDMAFHTQLGLDVDTASGKSLYVRHLQAGAVEEWNRKHPAHLSVHAGDRIVAVNGFAHDAQAMVSLCRELMQSRSKFQLRVRGPPPPPSESKKDKTKDTQRESKIAEKKPSSEAGSGTNSSSSEDQKMNDKGKEKEREKRDKEKEREKDNQNDVAKEKGKDKDKAKDKDRKKLDSEKEENKGKEKEKGKDKSRKDKKDKDKENDKDRGKKRARSDDE